ncbi:annexin A11-like [Mytilus galloprovincialis]|uniref:Annexin n=1 Tax=Mytilus edulis TaxID=6550 RepID=A0A8S3S307_MYTED|nr:ANXA7_11 [Mytilus edulis]
MPSPTIVPNWNYDEAVEAEAAEQLRNAMKGFGTDEAVIIECLMKYNTEQRIKIAETFKQAYGQDLIEELKGELGGDFEDVCVAMLTPPRLLDVKELNKSISGAGTDESTLVEIMCSRSNEEIQEIKELYEKEYECSLEDALMGDTGGYFGRLMRALVQGGRDTDDVDYTRVEEDAQKIFDAGAAQLGTEEAEINSILCVRSFDHLIDVFAKYEELSEGTSLEDAIKSETSSDLQDGFLSIIQCARNKQKYFAMRLNKAMKGFGTDDSDLIRLIVSRSEIDLGDIKDEFQQLYEKPLEEAVESECGGDYKRMLLALVQGNH